MHWLLPDEEYANTQRSRYLLQGHDPFPLTPALSLGERGHQSVAFGNPNSLGFADRLARILPLPKGEGRGEGEQGIRLSAGIDLTKPPCGRTSSAGVSPTPSQCKLDAEGRRDACPTLGTASSKRVTCGKASRSSLAALFSLGMLLASCALPAHASSPDSTAWRRLIEADWLAYEESLVATNRTALLPSQDAVGGCDGVKDGGPGFHTEKQDQPWWQVDLGAPQPVARVVIWNRCECAERALRLQIKLSDDGRSWTTVYRHDGRMFYGFSDNKPLTVQLTNQPARFVRIQLAGNDFLHLDEVEVFGPADVAKNLALHRPANQTDLDHQRAGLQHVRPGA